MKSAIAAVLTAIASTTAFASPQPASPSPSAERVFDCGAELRAVLLLRAVTVPGAKDAVYNGVVTMHVNGTKADPMTLRFVNEKIAGRTIDAVEETCGQEAMDLVFSSSVNGTRTGMLTVTAQGNTLKVH